MDVLGSLSASLPPSAIITVKFNLLDPVILIDAHEGIACGFPQSGPIYAVVIVCVLVWSERKVS